MIQYTLNSGAINTVPFPASEAGAAIIDLIGTVEVTLTATAPRLHFNLSALTAPSGLGSADSTLKRGASINEVCTAITADINALQKISLIPTATPKAVTSAAIVIAKQVSAIQSCEAIASVYSVQETVNAAIGSCAVNTTCNAIKEINVYPLASSGQAIGTIGNLKKLNTSALTVAQSVSSVVPRLKTNASINAICTADVLANARLSIVYTGTTSANAIASNIPTIVYKNVGASTVARGNALTTLVASKVGRTALGTGTAVAQVTTGLKIYASASTVAHASSSVAELDYSTNLPAHPSRVMYVPSIEIMKVGA